jgi:hypothetical protein
MTAIKIANPYIHAILLFSSVAVAVSTTISLITFHLYYLLKLLKKSLRFLE